MPALFPIKSPNVIGFFIEWFGLYVLLGLGKGVLVLIEFNIGVDLVGFKVGWVYVGVVCLGFMGLVGVGLTLLEIVVALLVTWGVTETVGLEEGLGCFDIVVGILFVVVLALPVFVLVLPVVCL